MQKIFVMDRKGILPSSASTQKLTDQTNCVHLPQQRKVEANQAYKREHEGDDDRYHVVDSKDCNNIYKVCPYQS